MSGRLKFQGAGSSIHKFASSSDGAMSVVVPHGQISDVIAELTGINVLRGLGLLLAKGQSQTDIRCGIVDFKDHRGRLDTTTVYVDTSNVLITGRGTIDLSNENLNLALQGDPKKLRLLRLRSPISLHGTLLHPAVGIQADKLAEQAGIATALGVLLTPAAAAIAFIDPGLAKDKDCSTVLAQANAGIT
jgi:AsmA family protein